MPADPLQPSASRQDPSQLRPTAVLALADGSVFSGMGVGAVGAAVGEVCFNTAMTGYQEILTDPSYAAQIITFTFPHIGNVGTNDEDVETSSPAAAAAARGCIVRANPTDPSNYRSLAALDAWLKTRGIVGLAGVDTRALTIAIRNSGMPHGVIAHDPDGAFSADELTAQAKAWAGLTGADLAKDVTTQTNFETTDALWRWGEGFDAQSAPRFHLVCIDYGVKRNILRLLAHVGARVTVVPATATADDILALKPDGVVLSNGPGDPAATAVHAAPTIRALIDADTPIFGVCLGHQLLALALGAKTEKMRQGHHGANHPVKDLATGKVEIVSMNHGFTVARDSLPEGVKETHVSLFDGTNCGIALDGKKVFSVQHHPEASPGPHDSFYIFERFADLLKAA
ncbi:MAG: glutamine-hydrolyzing carbamoyl-phosphate synthase small subunit [Pseudomonadota bacterium]